MIGCADSFDDLPSHCVLITPTLQEEEEDKVQVHSGFYEVYHSNDVLAPLPHATRETVSFSPRDVSGKEEMMLLRQKPVSNMTVTTSPRREWRGWRILS